MPSVRRKVSAASIFFLLVLVGVSLFAFAGTFVVAKNDENYATIQQAIDAANPGDTVLIKKGEYHENLTIEKDLILKGQGQEDVIIRGSEKGKPALRVGPSTLPPSSEPGKIEVKITGITINGTKEADSLHGCSVKLFRCPHGLFLTGQANVEITNVAVLSSEHSGIVLYESSRAILSGVEISKNGKGGVISINSTRIKIEDSQVTENESGGISLLDSAKGTIRNSLIARNKSDGVFLSMNSQTTVKDSKIAKNSTEGFLVERAAEVEIVDNEVRGNAVGVKISNPESFAGKLIGKGNRVTGNDTNFAGVSTKAVEDLTS